MMFMESFNNKKILITGGNGFIGSHLARKLVNLNANVSIIARNNNIEKIKDIKDKIGFFNIDLTDRGNLNKSIKKIQPEIIFHLASEVNISRDISLLRKSIENNLVGTVNLISSLTENGIRYDSFINTGTCEEYGNGKVPFKEDQSPIPMSPYSASKVASTYYCKMLYKVHNLPIVTLRPFLTYGPMQTNTKMFIPSLIFSCLDNRDFRMTGGEQTRDFIYIEDVVDAYLRAAISKSVIGNIINIGSGKEYRVFDVAKKIVNITGSKIKLDTSLPYRAGETMHFYCSNKKAKDLLKWTPTTGLEEGLKKTVGWYSSLYKSGELKKWIPQKS